MTRLPGGRRVAPFVAMLLLMVGQFLELANALRDSRSL
jgi:hypothetical protein